jgi:hypothetical protein
VEQWLLELTRRKAKIHNEEELHNYSPQNTVLVITSRIMRRLRHVQRMRNRRYILSPLELIIRQGSDWTIGFIDHLYTQLVTTGNYSATVNVHNLHSTITPASVLSLLQSPLSVSWQRILTQELQHSHCNCTLQISIQHIKSLLFTTGLSTLNWTRCHLFSIIFNCRLKRNSLNYSLSQSQSHFTTGGLQPISLSWRHAPWDLRPKIFPPNWTLAILVLT